MQQAAAELRLHARSRPPTARCMKACALVLRDIMAEREVETREEAAVRSKRQVHYLSMEFLMGRSLMKNAYNLGVLEPADSEAMEDAGLQGGGHL